MSADPPVCPHDGGVLHVLAERLPRPGESVGFRYRIATKVGDGGMCRIFSAWDALTARAVAIKLLAPEMATDSRWRELFLTEVAVMRKIRNDNVVRVYEGGISRDGHCFMSMELLDGQTLADRLATRGRLSPDDAGEVLAGVAKALTAVHNCGYVHRDIKPENIFLTGTKYARRIQAGNVRLMDLGVATPVNASPNGLTVDGTPAYMSPEQVSGSPLDERSDLYSLGVVLFEMITGKPCFDAEDQQDLMLAHLQAPAPRMPESIACTETGKVILEVFAHLMEKNPDLRPTSATRLLASLPWADNSRISLVSGW